MDDKENNPAKAVATARPTVHEKIATWAAALASQYDIDAARLVRIKERILAGCRPDIITSEYVRFNLKFESIVEQALQSIPVTEALNLLEKEDPLVLASRALAFRIVTSPQFPFYTREELANLAGAYADHLARNRAALVQTGYPETSFDDSLWFDHLLGLTYPVKVPSSYSGKTYPRYVADDAGARSIGPDDIELLHDDHGNILYQFLWAKPARRDTDYPTLCAYGDAPVATFLLAEADKIEKARSKLVDAKIETLRRLSRWGRDFDSLKDTWKQVSDSLQKHLTRDDIELFQKIDALCRQEKFTRQIAHALWRRSPYISESFSGFLAVVGHIEREFNIGVVENITAIRMRAARAGGSTKSYFQIATSDSKTALDDALDAYWVSNGTADKFWSEFRGRMVQFVEHEALCERTLNVLMTQQDALKFEQLEELVKQTIPLLAYLDSRSTGTRYAEDNLQADPWENEFRLTGQFWTVSFGDEPASHIENLKGMQFIQELLRHPGKELSALELCQVVDGTTVVASHARFDGADELSSADFSDLDGGLDLEAIRQIQSRLREVSCDLEDAKADNDVGLQERLSAEVHFLIDTLESKGGRLAGPSRRAADRVQKAIRLAIEKIELQAPILGRHLRTTVETGRTLTYAPVSPVNWRLSD